MSIKKQNRSLGNLYTIYEEVPECFLDETAVDIYFYHDILDIFGPFANSNNSIIDHGNVQNIMVKDYGVFTQ